MTGKREPFGYHNPDTFDVRTSLQAIVEIARRERKLILLTAVLSLALTTLYVVVWPPVYGATALLMVERDTDPVRDAFYLGWAVFRKDDARTEIELLTAGPVLVEVIEREGLTYADVYHPFMSHVSYLWGESFVGKSYRGVKRWVMSLFSDDDGLVPTDEELELARTVVDLRAGITIDPVAESNVGRVRVRGPSRKVAAIANTLVDVYLERRALRYRDEAQRSYDILSEEVERTSASLSDVEARRLAFSQDNGLAFDFKKEDLEVAKLANLEESIATSQARMAGLEANIRALDDQIAVEPSVRKTATIYELNTARETAALRRLDLQTALIETRNRFREDSPEVQEILGDLAELDAVMAATDEKVEKTTTEALNSVQQDMISRRNALTTELEGIRAGLAVMEATATRLRDRLASVPRLQAELRVLDREYTLTQQVYQELVGKQAQSAVALATATATMPSMRVVEYAVPPSDKSWPKAKLLFPLALLMGVFVGLAAAVMKSYLSGRVRREELDDLGELPLFGTIDVSTNRAPFAVMARDKPDAPSTVEQKPEAT